MRPRSRHWSWVAVAVATLFAVLVAGCSAETSINVANAPVATDPPAIPTAAPTTAVPTPAPPTPEPPTAVPEPTATAVPAPTPLPTVTPEPTAEPTPAPQQGFLGDIPEIADLPFGGPSYSDYVDLVDEEGLIVVTVPADWNDIDDSTWNYDGDLIGPALSAAVSLDGFRDAWGTPGVFLGASDQLPFGTTEEFLDALTFFGDECTYDGRRGYNDGLYVGLYDVYVQCGPEKSAFLQIVAAPEDGSFLMNVQLLAVTHKDWVAVERAIETFFADVPAA